MSNVENAKPPVKGRLIEMGDLRSADMDGKTHDYPKSILVQFDSVDDIRRALDEGICKFVWL
jgi:hypothetical protein